MKQLINLFNRILRNLQYRKRIFLSSPSYIREKRRYGLNRALKPYINLQTWVTTQNGAKIHLGKDAIDEDILNDLCALEIEKYFPDNLQLERGDVVLDVGAHHGLYAMEMIAHFPGIKVLCLEPDPDGVNIIRKHIRKNKANAVVIPVAIGSEEKFAFLADNLDGSWGKTIEQTNVNNAVKVPVKKLITVLDKVDLSSIKLIKSNCEGGEFELIPQLIELGIKPDIIILMIHPDRGNPVSLINLLTSYGYDARPVSDNMVNPCWHFHLRSESKVLTTATG